MKACGFTLTNARGGGSGRMFRNEITKQKVRLHEPHPQKTLLPYMIDILIEALETPERFRDELLRVQGLHGLC